MSDEEKGKETKELLSSRGWTQIAPGVFATKKGIKTSKPREEQLHARKKEWERRFEESPTGISVFLGEAGKELVRGSMDSELLVDDHRIEHVGSMAIFEDEQAA